MLTAHLQQARKVARRLLFVVFDVHPAQIERVAYRDARDDCIEGSAATTFGAGLLHRLKGTARPRITLDLPACQVPAVLRPKPVCPSTSTSPHEKVGLHMNTRLVGRGNPFTSGQRQLSGQTDERFEILRAFPE